MANMGTRKGSKKGIGERAPPKKKSMCKGPKKCSKSESTNEPINAEESPSTY